jgi:YtkA-like
LTLRPLAFALLALACASQPAPEPDPGWRANSDSGRLVGTLAPEAGEVQVGAFQPWILALRTADGAPVTGADLAITGGMPLHGHGLPTQPTVGAELPGGRYRIEGVKLNMHGAWLIEVLVRTAAGHDRLRFDLAIDF